MEYRELNPNNKNIVICGSRCSGKTELLKKLINKLYNKKIILFSNFNISEFNKLKNINKIIYNFDIFNNTVQILLQNYDVFIFDDCYPNLNSHLKSIINYRKNFILTSQHNNIFEALRYNRLNIYDNIICLNNNYNNNKNFDYFINGIYYFENSRLSNNTLKYKIYNYIIINNIKLDFYVNNQEFFEYKNLREN